MTFQKQLGMEWNVIIPTDELTPSFFRGVGSTTVAANSWMVSFKNPKIE
jgi:hypothetical protein